MLRQRFAPPAYAERATCLPIRGCGRLMKGWRTPPSRIRSAIKDAGLNQEAAAARLGIDQPKVSALMRGRLNDFSTGRLMRFLIALDRDVLILIRPTGKRHPESVRVLSEAEAVAG